MNPVEDVETAAAELVAHFGAGRIREYFNCFAPTADFIFYTHGTRLKNREEYEELWKKWEAEIEFKVLSCASSDQAVRVVGSEVAIFTHNVTTEISTSDGQSTVNERETIVFQLVAGSWLAIHEHLSPAA